MKAFLDTSVLLRRLLREPDPLAEWPQIAEAWACRRLPVEVGRVIDRLRLAGDIEDEDVATLHQEAREILRTVDVVALTEPILALAGGAMPTAIGTLDALHLATALEVSRHTGGDLVLATHDAQLATAARASGLDVIGA